MSEEYATRQYRLILNTCLVKPEPLKMKLRFLGTGTSTGIPQVGCSCQVCASADSRDKRLRTSAWIETDCGESILIDCGPDFRQQVLSLNHFSRISAVLLTHEHYDHVGGIDDLRPFCVFGEIPVYGDALCLEHQRERMPYCFAEHRYPGVPKISLHPVRPSEVFRVGKQEILPFVVMHAQLPIMGYRFGRTAYITDMKTIPDESLPLLEGVETLIVNGLRFEPHASHQTIEEAVAFSRRVQASRTYLVHMSHHAGLHVSLEECLPDNVHAAYDGLEIECR